MNITFIFIVVVACGVGREERMIRAVIEIEPTAKSFRY